MTLLRRIVPCLIIVVFVAAFWLPFGLHTTALFEEWLSYNGYERAMFTAGDQAVDSAPSAGGSSTPSFAANVIENMGFITLAGNHRLRPLQDTTTAFAHSLTPDSFVGLNLVHMASIIAKGIGLYLVLTQLMPRQRLFALSAALLMVVFPADRGLFTFRAIHIHGAVAMYLFAVWFLLRAWHKPRPLTIALMWACTVISLFIYEIGYALVAVTPAVLLFGYQTADFRRRLVRLSLLWYIAPVVTMLYAALLIGSGPTYQTWVLQRSGINQPSIVGAIVSAVAGLYEQHFIGGWVRAAALLTADVRFTLLGVGMAALAVGIGWWLFRADRPAHDRRTLLAGFVVGLGVIFFGFALFLITPYRDDDWRVFLYSAIGGSVCFVVLGAAISRGRAAVFALFSGVLLSIAAIGALHQHRHYVDLSLAQQELLTRVVRQVPQPSPDIPVVVVDETEVYFNNWSLGASYLLTGSLQYVYQRYDLQFILCSLGDDGQFRVLPELFEKCRFDADALRLYERDRLVAEFPYSSLIVLQNTADGMRLLTTLPDAYLAGAAQPENYDPLALFDPAAPLPRRLTTMFPLQGSADAP
jgi:hypothetical protein